MQRVIGLLVAAMVALRAGGAVAQAPPPAAAASASTSPPSAPRTTSKNRFVVAGAVLDGSGLIAAVVGIELALAGSEARCISLYSACRPATGTRTAGIATLIAGGALVAVGTPLLVLGIQGRTSDRPKVVVGTRSAALRWAF